MRTSEPTDLERDERELFGIKKVGTLEMIVPLGVSRIDILNFCRNRHKAVLGALSSNLTVPDGL